MKPRSGGSWRFTFAHRTAPRRCFRTNDPCIGLSHPFGFVGYSGAGSFDDLGFAGSLLSTVPSCSLLTNEDTGSTYLWSAILASSPVAVCGIFTIPGGRPASVTDTGSSVPEPATYLPAGFALILLITLGRLR
jgi:hypothetical protein